VSRHARLPPSGGGGRIVGCVQVRIAQIGGMSRSLVQLATTLPSTHAQTQAAKAEWGAIVEAHSASATAGNARSI